MRRACRTQAPLCPDYNHYDDEVRSRPERRIARTSDLEALVSRVPVIPFHRLGDMGRSVLMEARVPQQAVAL